MNPTANTRRAQRKERRRRERTNRWQNAASAAKWLDPDTEPSPSAWGRWTPPKRWRKRHADVMRFTRGQLAFVRSLFEKAFPEPPEGFVTVLALTGPTPAPPE